MLGLVLEGGGARGAFHIGAIKALMEQGYKFDGVAGTSIGAINGAIFVQGDFDRAYEIWQDMDNSSLFDADISAFDKLVNSGFNKQVIVYFSQGLKKIIDNRGIDTKKIRDLLESVIDEEKIRSSKIDFGIVTVSLSDFKPLELFLEDIPKGKLIDYIMASSNLPVFKSKPIGDKLFLDGAFYDNLPINLLLAKGYKKIIAIRTHSFGVIRKVEETDADIKYIAPSENVGTTLNFDNKIIRFNIKLGYFDAKRAIYSLQGKKYYIQPMNENEFISKLVLMPDELIYEMGEILLIPAMDAKRMLFERIFPAIAALLKLQITAGYQDMVIQTLEYLAQQRKVERFQILSFYDFINQIKNHNGDEKNIKTKKKFSYRNMSQEVLKKISNVFFKVFSEI